MVKLAGVLKGMELHEPAPEKPQEEKPPSLPRDAGSNPPAAATPPSPERIYSALLDYVDDVGHRAADGGSFDIRKGEKFIQALINLPLDHLLDLHKIALMSSGRAVNSLALHATNIAINSIILGQSLEFSKRELQRLGIAALFHELGMHLLPEHVTEKAGKLSDHEWALMKKHCEFGRDAIAAFGETYRDIAEVVYQEHERKDGSGYPQGLSGDDIHPHAYIIGLLDIFEALIQKRTYRNEISPADAMKQIISRSKGLFPNPTIKKLLMIWSFYPVKTYVRLNNRAVGMVVKTNPLWPLKPSVQMILDSGRKNVADRKETLDLSQKPLIYIKETLSAEEVSNLL